MTYRDDTIDLFFVMNSVNHAIFDLNSIPSVETENEKQLFQQIIKILVDRDFKVTLISENLEYLPEWQKVEKVAILQMPKDDTAVLFQNKALFSQECFWISENQDIQKHLSRQKLYFASSVHVELHNHGIQYQHIQDLLELFNPSRHTAMRLCDAILEVKRKSPKQPLIVGIGGPDECGHAFFIDILTEELGRSEFLVEGIDLTELLGIEYHGAGYWRSSGLKNWMMDEILAPFAKGQRIFIEEAPTWIERYETNAYPFFLAPEMILVVWGTTLFVPPLQEIMDWNILLELSPRAATARLYGIDERENFDPDFVRKYEETDGQLYSDYLRKHEVSACIKETVNFDNLHAFRFKH
ncbi:MAG: hypothetical protein HQM14_04405 [SAR324 cluster bacterium]|nr:hypothetical protein [SAR324 cluster bacterium]